MGHTPETRAKAYNKQVQLKANWFKTNGPCKRCSSWERLELDHINPTLKVSHTIWSWSEVRRNEELTKCQVLCYWCHLDKSMLEKMVPLEHGSTAYKSGRCRCGICKLAQKEYMQIWRERKAGLTQW